MDNLSFKSNIRLVSPTEFGRVAGAINKKKFVDYPWTIKQSVLAAKAYTTGVYDCTICGITDGQQVLLNHICPTNPQNSNFQRIADFIKNKINLDNPDLQAFILGSKSYLSASPNSTALFDKLANLIQELKIPCSLFKGGPFRNDVAYSSRKDEWIISNTEINENYKKNFRTPKEMFDTIFDQIEVSELDELSF